MLETDLTMNSSGPGWHPVESWSRGLDQIGLRCEDVQALYKARYNSDDCFIEGCMGSCSRLLAYRELMSYRNDVRYMHLCGEVLVGFPLIGNSSNI